MEQKSYPDMRIALLSSIITAGSIWRLFQYVIGTDIWTLTSFKDRAIGITVLTGYDVSARTKIYLGLVLLAIIIFLTTFALIRYLYGRFITPVLATYFNYLTTAIISLSIFAIPFFIYQLLMYFPAQTHVLQAGYQENNLMIIQTALFEPVKVVGAVVISPMIFYIVIKVYERIRDDSIESRALLYMVLASLVTGMLYIVTSLPLLINPFKLAAMLTIILGFFVALRKLSKMMMWKLPGDALSCNGFSIMVLSTSFASLFLVPALSGKPFSYDDTLLVYFPLLCILFLAGYFALHTHLAMSGRNHTAINNMAGLSLIPFLLIPLMLPLANEALFTISGVVHVSAWAVSVFLILMLVSASILSFVYLLKKPRECPTLPRLAETIYFPVILSSMIIFKYRIAFLNIDVYDMFHRGELLITNQQLFSFGIIPFAGNYPTHGLSQLLCQMLYSLVNGYRPIEPLLWDWLAFLAGAILIYLLLKKMTDPVFAVLGLIFFPLMGLIGNNSGLIGYSNGFDFFYYSFCLLPALSLLRTLERATFNRFLIHWIIVVFIAIWRVDFGISVAAGSLFIFGVYYLGCYHESGARVFKAISKPLICLVIVLSATVLLFAMLIILSGGSVPDVFSLVVRFVSFQEATAAYVDFLPYDNLTIYLLAALQYFVVPAIAISYVLAILIIVLFKKRRPNDIQLAIGFLATITLIMSVRSLQRHTLGDCYNMYFSWFLLICAPVFAGVRKNYVRSTLMIALLMVSVSLFFMIHSSAINEVYNPSLMPGQKTPVIELIDWSDKQPRLIDNKYQYEGIVSFLDRNLEKNQTFYDFTNSPLLYVFADRKDLSYYIPNLYQTSDLVQNLQIQSIESAYEQNEVPLVIFKQGNLWDQVDMAPNEIRSYRITEFIYQHYKPAGYVGHYQIWVSNNYGGSLVLNSTEHRTPWELNLTYRKPQTVNASQVSSSPFVVVCDDYPQIWNFTDICLNNNRTRGQTYLYLHYNCTQPGELGVYYGYGNSTFQYSDHPVVKLNISDTDGGEAYVPVPLLPMPLTDIQLCPPDGSTFDLSEMAIVERTGNLERLPAVSQHFDLRQLPHIWATYDDNRSLSSTPVQEDVLDHAIILDCNGTSISIDPHIDKSTGNYLHLKILSTNASEIRITYGLYDPAEITFDTVPSLEYQDYLIRISSQWAWMNESITQLILRSNTDVYVSDIKIRKGD